ncbi:MAG: hypothetical protein OEX12_07060 [Gammaproteobacteria bacterium]|nr:hypothetical protein [Gammaproteobacteria bacterium]
MATSPTQLTLKKLRKEGYLAAVTEHWNPFAKIRQDLFGFVDVLGVSEKGTIAVQATSYSNMSARVKKIEDHDNLRWVREAGWQIEVWGWHKIKNRWQVRVVDIS